jgi:hypothetical protein
MEIKISPSKIKNAIESHTSRLEQVEVGISGLKEKVGIKEKNMNP